MGHRIEDGRPTAATGPLAAGVVKLLLDGQQRMTSLYGVVRGKPPKFFDGNAQAFTGLRFHLESETFAFYQPVKMQDDPLWIDVTELMQKGTAGLGEFVDPAQLAAGACGRRSATTSARLSRLLGITDIDLHIEEVTGADKTLDVVVDIFNRVNSGGTKLSKGDLALAKICADWPEARDTMKAKLKEWAKAGYHFNLDWLLRSVNTVLTGEAKFQYLHDKTAEEIQDGLKRATKHIDTSLNLIGGRLGLDHDQVFFGRFGVPVMVRYLDQRTGPMDEKERDKLLFWFVQAGMWGRFSGSTESFIDQDLAALEGAGRRSRQAAGAAAPVARRTAGGAGTFHWLEPGRALLSRAVPAHPHGRARDWGTGLPLKSSLLGKMSRLEVHHIFPKAQLYKQKYRRAEVNALANFCFLTKDTNLNISDRLPEEYFPEVEQAHPGALASQWIPMDPRCGRSRTSEISLRPARRCWPPRSTGAWRNSCTATHAGWKGRVPPFRAPAPVRGGITSEEEEAQLEELNEWVEAQDCRVACWPTISPIPTPASRRRVRPGMASGLQEELSQPVAVLLNEGAERHRHRQPGGFPLLYLCRRSFSTMCVPRCSWRMRLLVEVPLRLVHRQRLSVLNTVFSMGRLVRYTKRAIQHREGLWIAHPRR